MRLLVVALAVVSLGLVAHASAALSPKSLVLQQADVTGGFRLIAKESGLRTNTMEAKSDDARRMIVRAGRITGYENRFVGPDEAMISSRADILKTAAGARFVLSWFDREARTAGIRGLKRTRVQIGTEGWVYSGRSPHVLAVVVWRHGRVFAGVAGALMPREQVLRLARIQQRRIAAALR